MPVVLPANLDLGQFTELSRTLEEKDLGDGKMRREFNLSIAAYEPGSYEILSVELTYFGQDGSVKSVHTQACLHITSLLANEPEPKLKENAGSCPCASATTCSCTSPAALARDWRDHRALGSPPSARTQTGRARRAAAPGP